MEMLQELAVFSFLWRHLEVEVNGVQSTPSVHSTYSSASHTFLVEPQGRNTTNCILNRQADVERNGVHPAEGKNHAPIISPRIAQNLYTTPKLSTVDRFKDMENDLCDFSDSGMTGVSV